MAHFAEIGNTNKVLRVLVVDNAQEHRGQKFLAEDLGLGGTWIQTSYNNNFKKQYAEIGMTYDADNDVFIAPQPYPSWTLNENFDWQAPTPMPTDEKTYAWDEPTLAWIELTTL